MDKTSKSYEKYKPAYPRILKNPKHKKCAEIA